MCMRTTCLTCGKPTWTGCGKHIEQAMAGVPVEARCVCPPDQKAPAPVPAPVRS